MAERPAAPASDEFWREFLTRGHSREHTLRRLLLRLPTGPRCRMCAAPFRGMGAPLMRLIGKRPSDLNPTMCQSCFTFIAEHHGGAEIDCTLLFADIRGSTSLAEQMTPTAFRGLLDRFYDTATTVVFEHEGGIDKFVGDEVVAMFFPLLTGADHAGQGIRAARALLRATGHADPRGPWAPIGAGVHTGPAWVGAVGEGAHVELTALGDAVNTTARLAAAAQAGEVLVSVDAAIAGRLQPLPERRSLRLKGKERPVEVVALGAGPPP